MNRRSMMLAGVATVWLVALGAISAQDSSDRKYTVSLPGGLAFSAFTRYEAWPTTALSRNDRFVGVILANPAIIEAYKAGIPANGQPFPDGAKMAKIHWNPKQNTFFPNATVPGG